MTIESQHAASRAFTWNAGGWFGSLFGSTLWLFIGALALFLTGLTFAGVVWIACGLLAVGLGLMLWSRRDRIAVHRAFQFLLWSLTALAAIALVTADRTDTDQAVHSGAIGYGAQKYLILFVFPLLSAVFAWRERSARGDETR
jgi:hypothetical protein